MMLRAGKKLSREVSLYEPIGLDKDGEAVSLVDVIETENKEMLEDMIQEQDVQDLYAAYRSALTDQEKEVVRMRYGLFGKKPHTQREIAGILGISRSYVSRIEKRALQKLRKKIESY
jgi:RNA polymerase sporulation-specific sigma factor